MFAVVRHPDIEALGIVPEGALAMHRGKGWVRISDFRPEPVDFHLPDFADAYADLDAPAPEKTESPAEPEQDEEQEA